MKLIKDYRILIEQFENGDYSVAVFDRKGADEEYKKLELITPARAKELDKYKIAEIIEHIIIKDMA